MYQIEVYPFVDTEIQFAMKSRLCISELQIIMGIILPVINLDIIGNIGIPLTRT